MKRLLFALFILFGPLSLFAQATWKSNEYTPEPYRKVMVFARISEQGGIRKQIEDYTVKILNDKGIVAIPAYANMKQTHVSSREEFIAIADSLKVDALLVYTISGSEKRVENSPTVSVGVGVGMYGGYAGASVPVAGGAKVVTDINFKGEFYNRSGRGELWLIELKGTLSDGADKFAYTLAKTTVKAMIKDGLFIKN